MQSPGRQPDIGALRESFKSMLPLVSEGEGFFGRSPKAFPSILSFFSAALDAEVSMADVPESKGTQKEAVNAE